MNYDEARRDLDARVPDHMEPDLERMRTFADLLGDPQLTYPSIHVTGTNGKTSVARMVTALLASLGIQAGTYTSPHLQDIRERLRVAGRPISREDFATAYEGLQPIAELVDERHDRRVTYFEMLTALAYWWFADHPVGVAVFEVGMGGTWDATNLVRGEVAVLNTIDIDHPELGSDPTEIAEEKAGIIKPGASVVTARQSRGALQVIEAAARAQEARIVRVGEADADVRITSRRLGVGGQQLTLAVGDRRFTDVFVPLHGAVQADNAALALAAVDAFLGGLDDVDDDVVREGFAAVRVPGRLEVLQRTPTVLLDGAHNPAGARRAAAAIDEEFTFRDVILVAGSLADKDIHGILRAFKDVVSHVVVTSPPSSRGAAVRAMRAAADEIWVDTAVAVESSPDVEQALEMATGVAGEGDGVLVTGSLYTVGAARDLLVPFDEDES